MASPNARRAPGEPASIDARGRGTVAGQVGAIAWKRGVVPTIQHRFALLTALVLLALTGPASAGAASVKVWTTTGGTIAGCAAPRCLLTEADLQLSSDPGGSAPRLVVDDGRRYQPITGFGGTMTDASAYLLEHDLSSAQRTAALRDLFDPDTGIGLSYIRVAIGGNDFSQQDYDRYYRLASQYNAAIHAPG